MSLTVEKVLQQSRRFFSEYQPGVGERVGVLRSLSETKLELFGYGTYQGIHTHPTSRQQLPRLLLDDGRELFGDQCWWDAEEEVRKWESNRRVVRI